MLEVFIDTIIDVVKLLPFLLITYIIMEYIEHKMTEKSKKTIKKSGKLGPLIGSAVGIIPQCGFSASATNLYAVKVISLGTLISVYLSTSDEMLPIFLSESIPVITIAKILLIKFFIGIVVGFIIDFTLNLKNKNIQQEEKIEELCEHEHCQCGENGIIKSALKHTLSIILYIFIVSLLINIIVEHVGEDTIEKFAISNPILGCFISSLVGLIPNCAASVILTKLYIQNIINQATLIGGLLTGAGVGLIVLFKSNKNLKENITITGLLYAVGVISGILLQFIL